MEKPYTQTFGKSFWSAFRGIKHTLRERNFAVMIFVGIFVLALSLAFNLSRTDKEIIVILVGFALFAETTNSACERILDLVTKEHNYEVGKIKDMLAGAVLIYSVTAAIVGLWILSNALR